jgi:cullin-4
MGNLQILIFTPNSQAVQDLCLHKMASNLYNRLQQECETHIANKLQSLVGQSPDPVVFLSLVEKCWHDHCDQMLRIRSIALYLDRTYVIQASNARSLWDMGLQLFRKHLALCSEVEQKTVNGLLKVIEKERYIHLCNSSFLYKFVDAPMAPL